MEIENFIKFNKEEESALEELYNMLQLFENKCNRECSDCWFKNICFVDYGTFRNEIINYFETSPL